MIGDGLLQCKSVVAQIKRYVELYRLQDTAILILRASTIPLIFAHTAGSLASAVRSISRRTSAAPPAVRGLETSLDYAHVEKKTKEAQTFIRQNMHVCTKSI